MTPTTRRSALKLVAASAAGVASLRLGSPAAAAAPAPAPEPAVTPAPDVTASLAAPDTTATAAAVPAMAPAVVPAAATIAENIDWLIQDGPWDWCAREHAAYRHALAQVQACSPLASSDSPLSPLMAFDRAALARTTSAWVRALRFGAEAAHITDGEATRVYLAWLRWEGDARHCADLSATYRDTLAALVATEPDATARAAILLDGDHPLTLLDEAALALFLQAWEWGIVMGAEMAGIDLPDSIDPNVSVADLRTFGLEALAA